MKSLLIALGLTGLMISVLLIRASSDSALEEGWEDDYLEV
ncbi:hypothetical protein SAMN05421739_1089 [Pontibacter chinhatensis]|uniref:Uncharacterized protein n=1 Tax=Pontibacter chinhatensis TaxID=1436961 RepID=A0A1I2YC43_9BACT|nr:hypothetical protein SAMN05421739_1089 [Pontibacter chinhatensis]